MSSAKTSSESASVPRGRLSLPLWHEQYAAPFAPTTAAEMRERGWDAVDVVFVTGDAYIDHPSFAMAILHRSLEQAGFRVAIDYSKRSLDKQLESAVKHGAKVAVTGYVPAFEKT